MDFFNKVGGTIVNGAKEVTDWAKDYTDATKLQYDINQKKKEINEKYRVLGQKYYNENRDKNDDAILGITAELEEINEMEERLIELKGGVRCENCGAMVPKDASFCSKCGAKVNDIFEEEENVKKPSAGDEDGSKEEDDQQ